MSKLLFAASLAIGLSVVGAVHAQDGAKLAADAGCLKCHDVEKKKMGPSFKSIAAKYKANKDAEKAIVAKLKAGEGHPQATLADAQLGAVAKWLLAM